MAALVRIGIAMTSNESIGKQESTLPHHHRRAHLDHPGSPVLGERHEIGHGDVARTGTTAQTALSTVFIAP
jgi:hypothetical protein